MQYLMPREGRDSGPETEYIDWQHKGGWRWLIHSLGVNYSLVAIFSDFF